MIWRRRSIFICCTLAGFACRTNRTSSATASARDTTQSASPSDSSSVRAVHVTPSRGIRSVSLADSTLLEFESGELAVYRVAVHYDSAIDTLPEVLTVYRPIVVGDSIVLGVAYDSTHDYSLFSYSAPRGEIVFYAPPQDLRLAVSVPAFSPDGRQLAYVGFPGDETGSGIVRRWPAGDLTVHTPHVTVPATDIVSGWASWTDTSQFEFDIAISDATYARFRGMRGQTGFAVDTLSFPLNH